MLITGRQLEHWHTGSMTRRASVLDALEPMATASMTGLDMTAMSLAPGDVVTLRSRRGEVALHLRRDDGTPRGAVFVPFAYYEAAANLMTNAALDPAGKIPEFKYCAVQVLAGGVPSSRRTCSVTSPRRERSVITSPGCNPSRTRSGPPIDAVAIGSSASSTLARRVMLPVCQCSSWRPVIRTTG